MSVRVTPTASGALPQSGRAITLSLIGPDRLGIVREIARTLAQREINVLEMDSQVDSAPMSGEMIFKARIDASVPSDTDLDDLHDTLEDIANQMTLEIDLEPSSF